MERLTNIFNHNLSYSSIINVHIYSLIRFLVFITKEYQWKYNGKTVTNTSISKKNEYERKSNSAMLIDIQRLDRNIWDELIMEWNLSWNIQRNYDIYNIYTDYYIGFITIKRLLKYNNVTTGCFESNFALPITRVHVEVEMRRKERDKIIEGNLLTREMSGAICRRYLKFWLTRIH